MCAAATMLSSSESAASRGGSRIVGQHGKRAVDQRKGPRVVLRSQGHRQPGERFGLPSGGLITFHFFDDPDRLVGPRRADLVGDRGSDALVDMPLAGHPVSQLQRARRVGYGNCSRDERDVPVLVRGVDRLDQVQRPFQVRSSQNIGDASTALRREILGAQLPGSGGGLIDECLPRLPLAEAHQECPGRCQSSRAPVLAQVASPCDRLIRE